LFGVETLSGVLAGALVSGVQVGGISCQVSNFGKICMEFFFLTPFHLFRLPSLHPTLVVPGTMPRSTLR